ncbi:hypothetical protein BGZ96_004390 [Linnemannia gamsii]|uniref:Uncharacterized protein n=1 Tax=Linnemannia gamsii TaxID=64522 RepID=A0ABQ7K791_9FUNG|nr:hypothetical protein BGZ96_004390 [Linnemannia gamsii]
MSSVVARSGSPPPPLAENADSDADYNNNNNNNNQDDIHGQEETDDVQTTTTPLSTPYHLSGDHYHDREQDQERSDSDDEFVEEDEYKGEGDVEWDDDDNVDDEFDDYDQDEPDPVYVADLLRQSGIDWLQFLEHATHRLVVTSTTAEGTDTGIGTGTKAGAKEEGKVPDRQYYKVMAQFLIPASAVFRDFLLGEDPITTTTDDSDADEGEQEFRRERLSCLQDGPFTDTSLADNNQFLNPANTPPPEIEPSLLEPLEPYIYQRYAPYTPFTLTNIPPVRDTTKEDPYAHQLWIHLSLPHPEHFPGLLRAMYDLDLQTWEETCFRPETIVGIIQTVRRLECSSGLMVRCLEYFRKVKDILSVEEFEEIGGSGGGGGGGGGGEGMEAAWRLYRAAVEGGMLPPDPDL